MFRPLLGTFFGVALGYLVQGPLGAGLGAVLGCAAGGLLAAFSPIVTKVPTGTPVTQDKQSVLCENRGRVAEATFVRDAKTGRWLDVAECTLCTPQEAVTCAKRCLVLMRDVAPASAYPVHA